MTMSSKIGTINNVVPNYAKPTKAGGTFAVALVQYTDQAQRPQQVTASIKSFEWMPQLQAQITALQPGQLVEFIFEKNDRGYNNLVSVVASDGTPTVQAAPASAAAAPQTGRYQGKSFDNNGAQVGNALTNAVALMNIGRYAELTIEQAAVEVLKTGESLKARLSAGEFKAPVAAPQVPLFAPAPIPAPAPMPPAPAQPIPPAQPSPVVPVVPLQVVPTAVGVATQDIPF